MIEALQTLANITDYTDKQLADLIREFGRDCRMHQLTVPVTAVIDARMECERIKDPGTSAVSALQIVAAAEAFVDVIDTSSLQGVSDIPQAPEKFLALQRAIDNMRGHRSK